MQVDPIKPTLKPPGPKRLKLKCDEPLSKFAFKVNSRRHSTVLRSAAALALLAACGRGSYSFPFQFNLSSSVHRITRLS